ncbi:type I pullulanase [Clostridium fallax]|uniref:Pullulanase n=1 Tax=Clostridium fallax TaxID=1533 RepID=A0A1M4Y223_9CLOT|nr:type I pullulanase [Clostridium fallax]SHE99613.1 pullulanase [Clostridium fallax]SQB07774.1 pullulanase [Clostridium fallax]
MKVLKEDILKSIKDKKDLSPIYESNEFEKNYFYNGDLGIIYSEDKTIFKLWSPVAENVNIAFYSGGLGERLIKIESMEKSEKGLWTFEAKGDLKGQFYNYLITINGEEREAVDPYAKAVGVNGFRGAIINLEDTNPTDWIYDSKPELKSINDSIIYELHVRDFSIDEDSGMINKGKFLAFTEENTKNSLGNSTGISHLKELGITHIHLLPCYDFNSIDESKSLDSQYNWGYDPENYNVPEGSYSTNPYNPETRIIEFKKAIKSLHDNGIRVIMDVVYNHTEKTEESNFHKVVPYYYHRQNSDGSFSNGSGCSNETASNRKMVRKFIIDSLTYWAKEYHIDGFRFDLMAIHDIETMNKIREELNKIDSSIIIYGEGWNGGPSTLPENKRASKANVLKLDNNIAAFSDDIRDGVKGHVFYEKDGGFVNGLGFEETIKFGVVASTEHPQINYSKINYSNNPWAKEPSQCINYVSAHDNLTLWDKISITGKNLSIEDKIKMDKLSNAIVLTSQGIPFIHSGEEFLRTKYGDENSYKSGDKVNKIDWKRKNQFKEVFNYYRGLIALRKKYSIFRMKTNEDIKSCISFFDTNENNLVAYSLKNKNENFIVIYNGNNKEVEISIPFGNWGVLVNENKAGLDILQYIKDDRIKVGSISALVIKSI